MITAETEARRALRLATFSSFCPIGSMDLGHRLERQKPARRFRLFQRRQRRMAGSKINSTRR